MQFKVNDKVELIDEPIKGRIVAIEGDSIRVYTEEGFEMEVHCNEIVKTIALTTLLVNRESLPEILKEKGDIQKQHNTTSKTQAHAPVEIDLHIHHLTDSIRGMTNYDMLCLQVEIARKRLEAAISNRTRKLVFIHGVGEGILKAELETLFQKYENIAYYAADYKRYGLGATEVYIYQNY